MKKRKFSHTKYLQPEKKQIRDYKPETIFADLLINKDEFIKCVNRGIGQLKADGEGSRCKTILKKCSFQLKRD